MDNTIQYLISNGHITQSEFDSLVEQEKSRLKDNPNSSQSKINALIEKVPLKNADEIFQSIDVDNVILEQAKELKINQLNYLCNIEILSGFTSFALGDEHQYGFLEDDQANISGTCSLLGVDSDMTDIIWKTKDAGFLIHSREEFIQVCKDSETHKRSKIMKYNQLKVEVNGAETIEDVLDIVW